MADPRLAELLNKLVRANHILDNQSIVDGFGFVAARNPLNHETFFIASQTAPALISSASELIEHRISDSEPLNPSGPASYKERYIMGELFRRYPEVNAAVHSHSLEVLPFCVAEDVPLTPVYHMAGFLGEQVHVWEIEPEYTELSQQDTRRDLLVSNQKLATSLATAFSSKSEGKLERSVVLQKNHGFVAVGVDIETAVFKAVYTAYNARVQKEAMALQGGRLPARMDKTVISDCVQTTDKTLYRSWKLWMRMVEVDPRYRLSTE